MFVLHGMSSSRYGKDDAHVRTLVEAGHRVFLVDYASENGADDRDPLTIQQVTYSLATTPRASSRSGARRPRSTA